MSVLKKGNVMNIKGSVDPLYAKLMRSVKRSIGTTEFYDFFMDALTRADNEFQFSNRRVEKIVDLRWVNAIESSLDAMQTIINSPRNFIKEEELIVNVAQAKKGGPDVVRHLAQHSNLVEDFNFESGDVRPSKLMQKFREDSEELYDNRLVFTTIEMAYIFTEIRYNALFAALGDEFGAKLRTSTKLDTADELIHFESFVHIKEKENDLEKDERNADVFAKIERLHRLLISFMNSPFCQTLSKLPRVKGNLVKTNVLKKNPNYKKIASLYDFLRQYDDVGYAIKITEQNPKIEQVMVENIFHNCLFQYITLKGYLELDEERELPSPIQQKKRKIRPKIIKEIIEELVEDYDLKDVEVRKILLEELTNEQLLEEKENERLRLMQEQDQRKAEEEAYRELLTEQEKERIRKEEEAKAEELRLEAEKAKNLARIEELEELREDERRRAIYSKELEYFYSHLHLKIEDRNALEELDDDVEAIQDYINVAKAIEDEEIREREAEELRLQIIDDERRFPIYRRELNNFFNSIAFNKELRDEKNDEIEIETISDYLCFVYDIEDREINQENNRLHLEFENHRDLVHQRIQLQKDIELERIRAIREKQNSDYKYLSQYRNEIHRFNKYLSVHRKERKEYNTSFDTMMIDENSKKKRWSIFK